MSSLIEAISKEQVSQKEPALALKLGSYVCPHTQEQHFTESQLMVQYRESKMVGIVTNADDYAIHVKFEPTKHRTSPMTFSYTKPTLKVLTEEEGVKALVEQKKDHDEYVVKSEADFKERLAAKRVKLMDREVGKTTDRNYLDSNVNFIKTHGGVDTKGLPLAPTGPNWQQHGLAKCCSLTKTTNNVLVYIPADWMAYYGYTLLDLKCWLAFLRKCDIGFNAKYAGEAKLGDHYLIRADSFPKYPNNNQYFHREMKVHMVSLPGSSHSMVTYLHFILIRYIYNMQYWNIPTIAMQIRKALGDKVTFWEALLVAHMNQTYYNYYCIVSNSPDSCVLPTKANTPKLLLDRLTGPNCESMNTSYKKDPLDYTKVADIIKAKEWDKLYELIVEWRKK